MTASHTLATLRDVQIAKDTMILSDLGKFPQEVMVYGLAYYMNDKRYYMVSTNKGDLIAFISRPKHFCYFPTPIEQYSERLAIPKGYEEEVINQIKLKMAQQLMTHYPIDLFKTLAKINTIQQQDSLDKTFYHYCSNLEWVFDAGKIIAFHAVCDQTYLRKNISQLCCYQLNQWCEKRLGQLADHLIGESSGQKKFYAVATVEQEQLVNVFINANLSCIYDEIILRLTQKSEYLIPCFKQYYAVHEFESLASIRQQVQTELDQIYEPDLLEMINQVNRAPIVINQVQFQLAKASSQVYGEKAMGVFQFYGRVWGISKGSEHNG